MDIPEKFRIYNSAFNKNRGLQYNGWLQIQLASRVIRNFDPQQYLKRKSMQPLVNLLNSYKPLTDKDFILILSSGEILKTKKEYVSGEIHVLPCFSPQYIDELVKNIVAKS